MFPSNYTHKFWPPDPYDTRTTRDREIGRLAAESSSTAEIDARLDVSPRSVETRRRHLMRARGLVSQSDLTRYALRRGIVPLED